MQQKEQNTATALFLDDLRSATQKRHTDLESLPLSAAIASPDVMRNQYGDYLRVMYDVILSTEKNVFPRVSGILSDLDERRKLPLISADLLFLGMFGEKKAELFQDEMSEGFALGIIYVIEGSTLGGRFLLNNATAALEFSATAGASFFAGYGNATGSKWKEFLNAMTSYVERTGNDAEVISGAQHGFEVVYNHFKNFS